MEHIRETRRFEELRDTLTHFELEQLVWKAARAGSVPAMRLAWQILRADGASAESGPLAGVDELAAQRARRAARADG